ncbi:MAG TPA: PA0069 family radical SAM protein, partial [Pirellulales bacterium]|jgi:DNA repair photolyase|nr:PA0069 family radical SAM protein [Pirellulales bacterium]
MIPKRSTPKRRGSSIDPPNRFEAVHQTPDFEHLEHEEMLDAPRVVPTQFLADASRSIITSNDSPDVGFRWSINPYRGCEHGCAYCYARPTHETLGLGAGLDFETKILVKHDAPLLLRDELCRSTWTGETIAISGVTDCYQPAERRYRLTRGLLEVMLEARQATSIITKNALVLRDLDLLAPMAAMNLVHVNVSVTTLDFELARTMEPRTSAPETRLKAIRELSAAGVPVRVLVAPVVPGLNDSEIPSILAAAAKAGAREASYVMLRLPLAVLPVFEHWLEERYPMKKDRVLQLVRSARDGRKSDSQFGRRMVGQGPYAEQIGATFRVFKTKHGLEGPLPPLDHSLFRPPRAGHGQMSLF